MRCVEEYRQSRYIEARACVGLYGDQDQKAEEEQEVLKTTENGRGR